MGFKVKGEFWKNLDSISKTIDEKYKRDPIFRAELDKSRLQDKCRRSHKKWLEDRDVHGHLGWYCARCGAWRDYYNFLEYSKYSFMTCDDILAEHK